MTSLRKSKEYHVNFEFIDDGTNRSNISYHMSYIEHLWKERPKHVSTTKSFINRAILIELASVIELILYDILSSLKATGKGITSKSVVFDKTITFGRYIEYAKDYDLIDATISTHLKEINELRNFIHIKKFHKPRILEYNFYTDQMVSNAINVFEQFILYIHQKACGTSRLASSYVWPWN